MHTRVELDTLLNNIPNVTKAYFRPPESLQISYPCIIYDNAGTDVLKADDIKYLKFQSYDLTVIDTDPESSIPDAVEEAFRYCSSGSPYSSDGLMHWPFTIYY